MLSGAETHRYRILLDAGQYARIVAVPRSGEVRATLFAPSGDKLVEIIGDSGMPDGAAVSVVAETSGAHQLEVRLMDQKLAGIGYRAQLKELRAATAQDRSRTRAEWLFASGEWLRREGGAESLRQAIEQYQQSIPLWHAAEDQRGEADVHSTAGFVYYLLADYRRALESDEAALALSRAAQATRIEADTLNNIALVFRSLGENQKAIEYYLQALSLMRKLEYRQGEAVVVNNIAGLYNALGQPREALRYHHEALALKRAEKHRLGEGSALNGIGLGQMTLREFGDALQTFDAALAIFRDLGDARWEATVLTNKGSAYNQRGEPDKALAPLFEALALRTRTGDRRGEASTLYFIAAAYDLKGDWEQSLEYRRRALAINQEIKEVNQEILARFGLAITERKRGDLSAALTQIEATLDIFESTRTKISSPELRATYLGAKRSYYDFYIDLLMELHQRQPSAGHAAAALQASERARARALLDILGEVRAGLREGVDPALLAREQELQRQIDAKAVERTRLLSGSKTEAAKAQAATLEQEMSRLAAEYEQTLGRIRSRSPRYAWLTQPQPLGLAEIQQRVLDDGTLLLEYALGSERSYLFAVTPRALQVFTLPKRAEIEQAALRFTSWFKPRKFETPSAFTERMKRFEIEGASAAAALGQMLLGPVADQLGDKRLLIVGDGALHHVPFAALPEPVAGRERQVNRLPLVVKHEIVNLPSASTLDALRRELAGRTPAPKTFAAFADPVFDPGDERVRATNAGGVALSRSAGRKGLWESDAVRSAREVVEREAETLFERLRYSRQEARAIGELIPSAQSRIALNFEANQTAATSDELRQYRYVHFATHGLLNERHPNLSGLVLSLVDRQGREQDGFLRLSEIFNLKLNAELVVLSACKTGLGRNVEGEGLLGLTRGFMYAGAPRLIVSLWNVSDRGTAQLMTDFYRETWSKGSSPAAALRAAQLSLLRQKEWNSPYYWAAFVLQGEPK